MGVDLEGVNFFDRILRQKLVCGDAPFVEAAVPAGLVEGAFPGDDRAMGVRRDESYLMLRREGVFGRRPTLPGKRVSDLPTEQGDLAGDGLSQEGLAGPIRTQHCPLLAFANDPRCAAERELLADSQSDAVQREKLVWPAEDS